MAWEWSTSARRYRETTSGRFLSHEQALALRDQFTEARKQVVARLAGDLKAGRLDVAAWEQRMREEIKTAHLAQAMLGRGGRRQMTPADWGRVGQQIRAQYGFLSGFADQALALSEAQTAARAALYVEAGTASFERGQAAAWNITLPAYPGDGSTACLSNCRCGWLIEEGEGGISATWQTSAGETCPDCMERAATWAPLVLQGRAVEMVGGAA